MTLLEQFTKSARESCRHFNGIQNARCQAGVEYQRSTGKAMPCIPKFINDREVWSCGLFEIMSVEDAEKEAAERVAAIERTDTAHAAAKADAKAKGLRRGSGGVSDLPCPVCDGGTLRYSVASYNGHMHAKCTTTGCVSWME